MKKILCFMMACILLLGLVACGEQKTLASENQAAAEQQGAVAQKAISQQGYGRKTYQIGDISFRVGDLVKDFAAAGIRISAKETLDPWGFAKHYASIDNDTEYDKSLYLFVVNESDVPQDISECRVVCVAGDSRVLLPDFFENQVTTREEILQKYNEADRLQGNQISYTYGVYNISEKDLGYGSTFNNIKFHFDKSTDVLTHVQIMCFDNVATELDLSKVESDDYRLPFIEASLLAPYFDTMYYMTEDLRLGHPLLSQKLDTKTLTLTLNGVDFYFGENTQTVSQWKEKGFVFGINELDEKIVVEQSYSSNNFSVNGGAVDSVELSGKHVSGGVKCDDALVEGIVVSNAKAVSAKNKNSASFSFYGLTENSTIENVVECLGAPYKIEADKDGLPLVQMCYQLGTAHKNIQVKITVDAINNCIYELEIITVLFY